MDLSNEIIGIQESKELVLMSRKVDVVEDDDDDSTFIVQQQ